MARIPTLSWEQISPAPVVLVFGKEEYLAGRAMTRLTGILKLEDAALEVSDLDASDYAAGELASLASPSLFGEPRLIRATRLQHMNDAFLADCLEYVAAPADGTTLVLRHDGSSVRGKKLLDAVRAGTGIEVACAPLKSDQDKLGFARAEFRAESRDATQGALRALVDAFSNELGELAAACQQLIDDTTGAIDEQTVRTYYSGRIETTAFDVADACIAGDAAGALVALRQALETGHDPVPVVAAFAMRYRQLAKVSAAGGSEAAAAKQLGMAPWQVRNARRDLQRFSEPQLASAIELIAETDAAVKGAERHPAYSVERMVRRLTTGA